MSTPGHARATRSMLFWSQAVALGIVLFPLSLQHVDYRATFSHGLSISAHKASPAYAAFEDLREDYASEFPVIPENGHMLAAGSGLDFKRVQSLPRVRQIALKGVTIRSHTELEPKPILVAGYTPRQVMTAPTDLKDYRGGLLPLTERKQRMLDQLKDEDWSITSPAVTARQLVEAALRSVLPGDRPQPSTKVADNDSAIPMGLHNPDAKQLRPLWLSGQVEMTGGLAFVGPEMQIDVKRMFNGQVFEQGHIWVTEGKFEIRVKQATGFLVAEVHTRDGLILGRGELNLLDLGIVTAGDRVNDLRIALRPSVEGATMQAIDGHSTPTYKIPVTNARIEIQAYTDAQKVNSEGLVNEPTLSRDSSFVARALAPDHWPSLVVGQAHVAQNIRLYPNEMVKALMGLHLRASLRKDAAQQAIIWGQIMQNGEPVVDAQVELAGDQHAIYFKDYVPLPELVRTTNNGLFAFLQINSGVQALRVRVGGKIYPAQVLITEERHVSYVELDIRDKATSQFKVFDGLNMAKKVSARVRLVGASEALTVGQSDFVQYSVAANPFMVEAEAGVEYEVSRVTVTGTPHVVHIPLVQREWLYRLAAEKNIGPAPNLGTVVGYMDDHDFEVELTGYRPGERAQIVYFDAQGKALDSQTGVAGGGFVIFNAPGGLQTVYIHPTQSRETFSQVLVAEPEFVQVIAH